MAPTSAWGPFASSPRVSPVTIHATNPFAEGPRDPARQLRGRLVSPVTLWTAGDPAQRAGITVSSTEVVRGEPGRLLGLIDPLSGALDLIRERGTWVVSVLSVAEQRLSDAFGGLAPVPGGPFTLGDWEQTPWGPRPGAVGTWAGVRLESIAELGWSALVVGRIESVAIDDRTPLAHLRGRYGHWAPGLPTGPGR